MLSEVSRSEAAYFDQLLTRNGKFNPFRERGWRTLARRFGELKTQRITLDVLDVGCGTGQSRAVYIEHCHHYTGLDLSETAISLATKKFPESNWLVGNAICMPFPDNSFDVVAFSSVLHHIPHYESAVHEARRVVRPGGMVFAFDPNLLNPAMAMFRWPKSPLYSANGVSPNERPLLPRELRSAFMTAGLVDLRQRCQCDLPYRTVAPPLLKPFVTLYNTLDWLMARTRIDRFLGAFILTCGCKPEAPA